MSALYTFLILSSQLPKCDWRAFCPFVPVDTEAFQIVVVIMLHCVCFVTALLSTFSCIHSSELAAPREVLASNGRMKQKAAPQSFRYPPISQKIPNDQIDAMDHAEYGGLETAQGNPKLNERLQPNQQDEPTGKRKLVHASLNRRSTNKLERRMWSPVSDAHMYWGNSDREEEKPHRHEESSGHRSQTDRHHDGRERYWANIHGANKPSKHETEILHGTHKPVASVER